MSPGPDGGWSTPVQDADVLAALAQSRRLARCAAISGNG
jgi:hypothetical protein